MKSFADWTQEIAEANNHEPEAPNPFRPSARVVRPDYGKCADCGSMCRSIDGTWSGKDFHCDDCHPHYYDNGD